MVRVMKIEITERDKRLLTILAIFVIVVCVGWWGIRPQINRANEIAEEIEEAEKLQSVNEAKVSQLMFVEGANQKLEQLIIDARENYYPMMTSDEIGNYITNMVIDDYGLGVYSLNIGPVELAGLAEYRYSEKHTTGKSEALNNALEAAAPKIDESGMLVFNEAVEKNHQVTGIYSVGLTMRLNGDGDKISRLLDNLALNKKKMRLVDYSVDVEITPVTYEDGTVGEISTEALMVSLEIYMTEV